MTRIVRRDWLLHHPDGRSIAILHMIEDGADVVEWAETTAECSPMREGRVKLHPLSPATPQNEARSLMHWFYGQGYRDSEETIQKYADEAQAGYEPDQLRPRER